MTRIASIALAAVPMSIGMGAVVSAMFPFMSSHIAGMVGGAVTVPALFFLSENGRWS